MKANAIDLLTLIRNAPQFEIPIYQRNYSWTAAQCAQLWQDLLRAGRADSLPAHFLGSVVYVQGSSTVGQKEPLQVIDGQQRLTTVTLLILALAQHFEKHGLDELLDAFSAIKLREFYLINRLEKADRYYKLCLSESDNPTLRALLAGTPLPQYPAERLQANHALFVQWLDQPAHELQAVCKGLGKLMVVEVALDRHHDNPQLIFESMNSTGLDLTQADLIRNYVLMGLPGLEQTQLYQDHWRPMEQAFGSQGYAEHFDSFMRHYLTLKTGEIPNIRQVYSAFKAFAPQWQGGIGALVADIHVHAKHYAAMVLDQEPQSELRQVFADLRELRVDVAYPLLLKVYADYQGGVIGHAEVLQMARCVESYVFRRAVCNLPTNSLGKTFVRLARQIEPAHYVPSVQAALLREQSYRAFPPDDEFQAKLKTKDLYRFPRRNYWLRRLENHGKKERVAVENYTIEHILPQNPILSADWQRELGADWARIQTQWLHTIGNLTLTAYNSQYSDRPYASKRDLVDEEGHLIGLGASPLKLNRGLGKVHQWTEKAIRKRADRLCKEAARVWARPDLPPEVLARFDKKLKAATAGYAREHFPALAAEPTASLFEALRREVLALDGCVSEEYLKLYIAYKAEYNFVDVVPQAAQLKLHLNMKWHQLDDPRGMAKDVSEVGHWGNGDVQVILKNLADLPYVLGLIRQALERQLEDTPDA